MHAGVDNQTHGPEHLVVEPTKITERVIGIQRHVLRRQPLRVQRPALGECGKRRHAPQDGDILNQLRGRNLKVMAG